MSPKKDSAAKEVLADDDSNENESFQAVGEWSEDRQTRETWTGKLDFILSAVGYAVGFGNVWRFPYICFKNGGGAFLIPYVFFLALCGVPMVVLEMSMGQFMSLCSTAVFQKFCPLFQGLGWAQVMVSAICAVYYNMIIAWTLYYLWESLRATVPWASCGHWWNSLNCVSGIKYLDQNDTLSNVSDRKTASEEFWENYILQIDKSSGIDDLGGIQWQLTVALLIAWVIVFSCLCRGVHTSGRVVHVTATFPYIVLFVLMIRGVTLPGAMNGIKYYLIPEWRRLLDVNVWIAAGTQIFYSLAPAWGVLITFGSFNKFKHNIYRDATIVPVIACATSVFAGIVVFSIIGYMATEAGKEISEVIASGPGLFFIVYPEAVAKFPLSPLWSVLFFLMVLTIGVDSQFGAVDTVIMAFVDTWPDLLRKRKMAFTGFLCTITFFLGLPCCTRGGMYILQLMDWYVAAFSVMLIGAAECILLSYNYGVHRFMADINLMVGRYPGAFFKYAWMFITPALALTLMITNLAKHTPVYYDDYQYPPWAIAVGWLIAFSSSVPIPFYMILNIFWRRRHMPFREAIRDALRPTPDFGPSRLGDRVSYRKSLNQIPSKQLYVLGVEEEYTEEMVEIATTSARLRDGFERAELEAIDPRIRDGKLELNI